MTPGCRHEDSVIGNHHPPQNDVQCDLHRCVGRNPTLRKPLHGRRPRRLRERSAKPLSMSSTLIPFSISMRSCSNTNIPPSMNAAGQETRQTAVIFIKGPNQHRLALGAPGATRQRTSAVKVVHKHKRRRLRLRLRGLVQAGEGMTQMVPEPSFICKHNAFAISAL